MGSCISLSGLYFKDSSDNDFMHIAGSWGGKSSRSVT